MAKMLDFNSFNQPTLPVVFNDGKRTTINVTVPSERLIEKLDTNRADITAKLKNVKNVKDLKPLYEFTAELMSNNEEGIKFTGAELQDTYNVNYMMLFAFFVAYLEFINEIKSTKN